MEIAKIITVYLLSTLKFLLGVTGGYAAGWNIFLTILITIAGMMTSVVAFTYFGHWLKRRVFYKFFRNRKTFTPSNRRWVRLWKKYGLAGISFFTPILLMPIGGTLVAASFETNKKKIIVYMLVSAVLWAVVQTYLLYTFGDMVKPYLE